MSTGKRREASMTAKRDVYFPWVCRKIGSVFFVKGWEPVYKCPACGTENAFEKGDCRRVFAEEVLERERVSR